MGVTDSLPKEAHCQSSLPRGRNFQATMGRKVGEQQTCRQRKEHRTVREWPVQRGWVGKYDEGRRKPVHAFKFFVALTEFLNLFWLSWAHTIF